MSDIKFPYKPNIATLSLSILLLFFLTIIVSYIANADTQFLFLYRIFDLSIKDEIIIYWCLSASFGLLTLFGLNTLAGALMFEKEIVLSEDKIIIPENGVSKKTITFKFSEVTDVYVQAMYKQKTLNILHPQKKLSVHQNYLPSKKSFDELAGLVIKKVNG